jgi:uncharacterized phage protein (TIGR01671 family)
MREIKFRAWDKELKEFSNWTNRDPMFNVSSGDFFFWQRTKNEDGTYGGDIILRSNWGERFILQQYTGLKDKNDVEIYEGDILSEENSGYGYKKLTIVEWRKSYSGEQFCEVGLNSELVDYYGGVNPESSEVVGNIYENPEMLL